MVDQAVAGGEVDPDRDDNPLEAFSTARYATGSPIITKVGAVTSPSDCNPI